MQYCGFSLWVQPKGNAECHTFMPLMAVPSGMSYLDALDHSAAMALHCLCVHGHDLDECVEGHVAAMNT